MTTTNTPDRKRAAGRAQRLFPYALVGPAVLFLLVMMAYPLYQGVRLSFTDTSLLRPNDGEYIGLENYRELFEDEDFWRSLRTTILYTIGSVTGAISMGLLAALGMTKLKGRFAALRGFVIIPWAVPMIPVVLVSAWILDPQYGVLNYALSTFGLIDENVAWLNNESTARWAILGITIWRIFPFSAIVLLSALQSVQPELYEAARVDGASSLNQFKNVTLPAIRPSLSILALFVTIWSLRRFDLIWVLTEGGPLKSTSTLVIELYREGFRNSNLGAASAIGVVGLAISFFVTAIYFLVQRRSDRLAHQGEN
jgi:multiple sugar transport system permease protein